MGGHFQYNDDTFEKQFEDCSFPPNLFSHEAHLRLAYIHIQKYGLDQAIENLCAQIKRYDQFHDKGTKFHVTITVASAKIVHHFIKKHKPESFHKLKKLVPDLAEDLMGLIKKHYSSNILETEESKGQYIKPNLSPF